MHYTLNIQLASTSYVRNPDATNLGKQIIAGSIDLMHELGFEEFTFRKLATKLGTTEAGIYRYFENKHKLLLYISAWYWSYLHLVCNNICGSFKDPNEQIRRIVHILVCGEPNPGFSVSYDLQKLNQIIHVESSKVYLVRNVSELNSQDYFIAYKDLCSCIADVIQSLKPDYTYPHSLASTIIETAHQQLYFVRYLPRLTDGKNQSAEKYVQDYLQSLIDAALR
ncbi:MAG: hypothetical protein RL660_2967 [Bacteroidota bacterium]|jgi:AcrR family transcriptional regulator